MNILFILNSQPNPHTNADWTRIGFLAKYFVKQGNGVSVVGAFPIRSLGKAGRLNWKGVTLLNVTPVIIMENLFSLIFNLISSVITSVLLLAFLRPDVIILSVPNGETAVGFYLIGKLFRIRNIVFDYRDQWEDFAIMKTESRLYRWSYKHFKNFMTKCYLDCSVMITVTQPLADSLLLRGIRDVKILPNGADISTFRLRDKRVARRKLGFKEQDFILVYSGAIGGYYTIDLLVRALPDLIRDIPMVKLVLVGAGPALENVMNLSKDIGVQDHVFYLGEISEKIELAEILCASDVGLVPYDANPLWKNSLPAKSFEYFACGLPIVAMAYDDSLISTLIGKYGIGVVSQPGDILSVSQTIKKLYDDTWFRKDASKRAVSLVEQYFDRRKIARQFLELLHFELTRYSTKT